MDKDQREKRDVRELSVMNLEAPFAGAPASPLPQLDISHHVTEDLVLTPEDNAPPDTDTTTPARTGILARLFGSSGT